VQTVTVPDPSKDDAAPGTVVATKTVYDGAGNPIQVTNADLIETDTSYTDNNLAEDVTSVAGPRHETQTIYNANGATIGTASFVATNSGTSIWVSGAPDGWQTQVTSYNTDGSKAAVADGTSDLGTSRHTTSYANYDPDGNVGTVTSPRGFATSNTYTADGLLKTTTKPFTGSVNRVTTYGYDPAGRKESQQTSLSTGESGGAQYFAYYANDLPATETGRASGQSTGAGPGLLHEQRQLQRQSGLWQQPHRRLLPRLPRRPHHRRHPGLQRDTKEVRRRTGLRRCRLCLQAQHHLQRRHHAYHQLRLRQRRSGNHGQ
jgi:YD repeat-containing protein